MTNEELKKWQDSIMETAKGILQKDGHVTPVMFVLSRVKNVPLGDTPNSFLKAVPMGGEPPGDYVNYSPHVAEESVVMVVPLLFSPVDLLGFLSRKDAKLGKAIEDCAKIAMAMGLNGDKAAAQTLRAICRLLHMEDKDIVAEGIVQILRDVKAEAFVKLDEIWHLRMQGKEKRDDYPRSLEDCEEAGEALSTVLECDDFRRMVVQPFERTVRNTGDFKAFVGEPQDNTEDLTKLKQDEKTYRTTGRFVGLLERSRTIPFPQRAATA